MITKCYNTDNIFRQNLRVSDDDASSLDFASDLFVGDSFKAAASDDFASSFDARAAAESQDETSLSHDKNFRKFKYLS